MNITLAAALLSVTAFQPVAAEVTEDVTGIQVFAGVDCRQGALNIAPERSESRGELYVQTPRFGWIQYFYPHKNGFEIKFSGDGVGATVSLVSRWEGTIVLGKVAGPENCAERGIPGNAFGAGLPILPDPSLKAAVASKLGAGIWPLGCTDGFGTHPYSRDLKHTLKLGAGNNDLELKVDTGKAYGSPSECSKDKLE